MSKATRINRPTTATPRKAPAGRLIHVATNYGWIGGAATDAPGPARFVKVARGNTLRKGAQP